MAEDDLDTLLAIRNAPAVIATTNTGDELPARAHGRASSSGGSRAWRERGFGSWLVLLDG